MSFRFDVDDGGDEFTQDEQGNVTRTIKQVKDLFEVSTVTIPAYDDSNVQVDKRSYEKFINANSKEKDNKTMRKEIIDALTFVMNSVTVQQTLPNRSDNTIKNEVLSSLRQAQEQLMNYTEKIITIS